jgi:3-isopropylmalate dehydrogenase
MLLRHSLGLEEEARAVERAAGRALDGGALTPDLAPERPVGTAQAGRAVVEALLSAETGVNLK